ncbi:hypothetical protein M5D96_006167, partial [Drosophila gunungcola]
CYLLNQRVWGCLLLGTTPPVRILAQGLKKQSKQQATIKVINQLGPSFIDQRASFGKQTNKSRVRFAYDMQMGPKEMANRGRK